MKKITVLTGSPRKNGNSFAMTDAFIRAAEAKGHQVTRIDAAFLKVGGCRGCQTCYKTGKPCSFDDDFNTIAPSILEADVLVFTMPVYWYNVPAQLKAVIDKLFSFCVAGKEAIYHKECALITCCEETDPTVMDGVRFFYERSAALMHWTDLGQVCIPGVFAAGDIAKTDGVARAAALADAL